jgi:O-succinylbenzoic acid--CoA ligase
LVGGAVRWTFSELAERAIGVAAGLRKSGIGRGDRVVLSAASSADWVACLHGIACVGAVSVPLAPKLSAREATDAVSSVEPRLAIADAERFDVVRHAFTAARLRSVTQVITLERAISGAGTDAALPFEPDFRPAGDSIVFTSGTSGAPKPVVLSQDNFTSSADATAERLALGRDDVWLAPMPLHHVGGLSILLRSLRIGLSVVLMPKFDPERLVERIETEKVTIVSVVPTMLHALLERQHGDSRAWNRRFPHLRIVLVGGGPLPDSLARRALDAGVPIATTYGLTETTSQISTATVAETAADPSHCGRPLRGVEVRLRDVGADGYGTLCVRGPQVTAGYFGEPPHAGERFDEGWFVTGDIAHVDEDGRIRIAMRREDRIVSGGENVSPAEVEAVLVEHPDVSSAGVYALDDEKWGQVVAAAVVLRPGAKFAPERLIAWCRERLAPYKVPRRIEPRESLPFTAAGKLRRFLLSDSE